MSVVRDLKVAYTWKEKTSWPGSKVGLEPSTFGFSFTDRQNSDFIADS